MSDSQNINFPQPHFSSIQVFIPNYMQFNQIEIISNTDFNNILVKFNFRIIGFDMTFGTNNILASNCIIVMQLSQDLLDHV